MAKTVTHYQPLRISDMTEGSGHMSNDLAFVNYQDAAALAKLSPEECKLLGIE